MHIKKHLIHNVINVLVLLIGGLIYVIFDNAYIRQIGVLITLIAFFISNILYHKHHAKLTKAVLLEYLLICSLVYLIYLYISLF
jgi:hypothetical protein